MYLYECYVFLVYSYIDFKAITFTTYGGFGEATHDLINKLTSEAPDYDFDPWARPGPKLHAWSQRIGVEIVRGLARIVERAATGGETGGQAGGPASSLEWSQDCV